MPRCMNPSLPTRTRNTARKLRVNMTDAERILWYHLRGSRLGDFKFRRQHAIPPYVVDFYCDETRLIIEVDGSQHHPEADATRTAALDGQGLRVLRFWDNHVLTDLDAVLNEILEIAWDRTLTRPFGAPSPGGRGEQQRNKA